MKYLVYLILLVGTYCEAKVVHSGGHREFVGSGSSTGSGGYGGSWWPHWPPVPEDILPPPLPELHHGPVLPEYYSLPEVKPYHEQYGFHCSSSSSSVPSMETLGTTANTGRGHRSSYYYNPRPRIYHPPVKSYYRFPYNYYVTGKSDDAGNDISNVKTDVDVLAFAKGNSVAKAVAVIDVGG